jgi:Domain of unknown function (DUF4399)
MKLVALATVAVLGGFLWASSTHSQPAETGGPTPSPPGAKAEFLDVKDGAVIGPKTTIHFGLHGMGVAPAGTKKANTGHFHLLIDRDLPPLDKQIPNDENDLHFGAGQTETELTLPPGPHTLQLLLGDADHIPHSPPVYSDKIHVTAVESPPAPAAAAQAAPGTPHPSSPGARVYIISPVNGAYMPNTFTVRFGLVKMGVAPAGVDKPNTGHHHLLVDAPLPPLDKPIPNDENHLHFGTGQTETVLTLPSGRHTLQLLLGDTAHLPHQPPIYSDPIVVNVGVMPPAPRPVRPPPAPRPVRRHHGYHYRQTASRP